MAPETVVNGAAATVSEVASAGIVVTRTVATVETVVEAKLVVTLDANEVSIPVP